MRPWAFAHDRARKDARSLNAAIALGGFAAGAAFLALLEPRGGARRRGLVVQKTIHGRKAIRAFAEKAARDLANRSRGLAASVRSSIHEAGAPDEVLSERVRSRIGRLTSHPSAIEVSARDGVVELRGPILEPEAEQVVRGTRRVHGVLTVVDRLDRHGEAGGVSALQGGSPQRTPVPEMMTKWPPGTRLVAIILGAALAVVGWRARRAAALPLGVFGASLALRGLTNLPLQRLVGIGAGRRAADLRRAIHEVRPLDAFDPGL